MIYVIYKLRVSITFLLKSTLFFIF